MDPRFDIVPDRKNALSVKWHVYGPDVLPMWVADMDFRTPETVVAALQKEVDRGVFGYPYEPEAFKTVLVNRMDDLYNWRIDPKDIVLIPGVVTGLNIVSHLLSKTGGEAIVQTPIYPPFLSAPQNGGMKRVDVELERLPDGGYAIDFDRFEQAITGQTKIFLLCNPHNPVGRVYRREELERLAGICLRHGVLICSDEIHSDLIFSESHHIPIASLNPEIAHHSITLMAPSKTFNIPGLQCSFAIIPDPDLRARFQKAGEGMVGWVNLMGLIAGQAAYEHGGDWLRDAMAYLQGNRDYLYEFTRQHFPGVHMVKPEGTYLAWLDCRDAGIEGSPYEYFLQKARVAVNDGKSFGMGGEGFIRLNFGCPRSMLEEALARMQHALQLSDKRVEVSAHVDPFASH